MIARTSSHRHPAEPAANHVTAGDALNSRLAALQTAAIIGSRLPSLPLHTVADARERHLGLLQGVLSAQAAHTLPAAHAVLRMGDAGEPLPGGGESENAFYERTVKFLDRLAHTERGAAS